MHQGINDNMQFIFRNTTFLCSYYNVNESGGIYVFLFINQSVHATAWHLAHRLHLEGCRSQSLRQSHTGIAGHLSRQ
jgi:cytochrome c-type biogenesis protein CcmH/NrfF